MILHLVLLLLCPVMRCLQAMLSSALDAHSKSSELRRRLSTVLCDFRLAITPTLVSMLSTDETNSFICTGARGKSLQLAVKLATK